MKHKHYECIVAWAEGKQIQFKDINNEWVDIPYREPQWDIHVEYRIKPEPKPDVVAFSTVYCYEGNGAFVTQAIKSKMDIHNLKLTWDGETRELKSAEVI